MASSDEQDALLVVEIPNVRLYEIREERRHLLSTSTLSVIVSTLDHDVEVYVLILDKFQVSADQSTIVIRVGAALEFLFPSSERTFGIVLPADADASIVDVLESIFADHCTFRRAPRAPAISTMPDAVDKWAELGFSLAAGLDGGSEYIANGIRSTSTFVGQGIHSGSDFIISRTDKVPPPGSALPASSDAAQAASKGADSAAEQPSSTFAILSNRVSSALQEAQRRVTEHVDESMQSLAKPQNRLKTSGAKTMAGVSVKVSRALVTGVTATAVHLSNHLTEAVLQSETGKKIVSANSPRSQAAKEVARSSITAVARIGGALMDSAAKLLNDSTTATANVIEHRYGAEVGESARNGLEAVSLFGSAAIEFQQVGVKAVAARTAVTSAMTVLNPDEQRPAVAPAVDPALSLGAMMLMQNVMQENAAKK